MRSILAAALAACLLIVLSSTTSTLAKDGTRPKVPRPPSASELAEELLKPENLKQELQEPQKPPEEGQVDVLFTPDSATIRVWKAQKWVTVRKLPLNPKACHDGAGIPYNHKEMKQFFEWEEKETPPKKKVTFVVVQQKYHSQGLDPKTGEVMALVFVVNFYHCLVDPNEAKVVKEDFGSNVVYLRKVPGPKEEPESKPEAKPASKPEAEQKPKPRRNQGPTPSPATIG